MKYFASESEKRKALYLVACLVQLGDVLDVLCWTPLRDVQVFAGKAFGSISGPMHPILSAAMIGGSLLAISPYLAKVFNKNEVDSLQEVLDQIQKELGLDIPDDESLKKHFQDDLEKRGMSYLQVEIKRKTVGRFRKKTQAALHYKFSESVSAILSGPGDLMAVDISANEGLDENTKSLLLKMLDDDKTLAESREIFFKRFSALTPGEIAKMSFETAVDVSFQYWLAFFVFDMFYSNADSTAWNLKAQFITLGVAVGLGVIKLLVKFGDYIKRIFADNKTEKILASGKKVDIQYADKSLQKQQLLKFYSKKLRESNAKKLSQGNHVITKTEEEISEILQSPIKGKSFWKRVKNKFFSIVKSVGEYEEIIIDATAPKKSALQRINSIFVPASFGIGAAFIEWFVSAAASAFSLINAAKSRVADFFNGLYGGIVGILSFVVGTGAGVLYYNKSVKPAFEKDKEAMKDLYEKNREKISALKKIEVENKKLRHYLKERGIKPVPTLKPYDDRAYRRMTVRKTKGFTLFKKTVNRVSTFVGRMGTGILLFRFLPLAILACLGVSLAAAASAVFWPITVAALVFGIAFGALFVYKYVQERRLESAKRFLNRIDITLKVAKNHNNELLQQLGCESAPLLSSRGKALGPILTQDRVPGPCRGTIVVVGDQHFELHLGPIALENSAKLLSTSQNAFGVFGSRAAQVEKGKEELSSKQVLLQM
jgi:hypothetical protein